MPDHENPDAAALERAAEWRLRQADANPADTASIAAARHLQKLANDLRAMPDTKLSEEYRCLFHWLSACEGVVVTLRFGVCTEGSGQSNVSSKALRWPRGLQR